MNLENLSNPSWYSLEQLFIRMSVQEKILFHKLTHLLEVDSLTAGLEQINPDFSVHLISLQNVDNNENSNSNSNSERGEVFCRKVELLLSNKPVIYAESICSIEAEVWKQYLHCGTNSLGRALFSSASPLQRSPFSYALFSDGNLPTFLAERYPDKNISIIARRSYFIKNDQKLWITEWFLPSLQKIL